MALMISLRALTRVYGKGRITYVGSLLDEKLMAAAAQWMTQKSCRDTCIRSAARWRGGQPSSRYGQASLRSQSITHSKPAG